MEALTLEQRIQKIEDQNAIERLRHEYWLFLMDRNLEGLVSCFADDAFLEYGFGIELTGKADIKGFFENLMSNEDLIQQVPRGANRVINLNDENNGDGRWLVDVVMVRKSAEKGTRLGLQYTESYKKIDGLWKIFKMKNEYLHFEDMDLKDSPM